MCSSEKLDVSDLIKSEYKLCEIKRAIDDWESREAIRPLIKMKKGWGLGLLIGIDFDNTIVSYDKVFHKIAVESGYIPSKFPISKIKIRDYLRKHSVEDKWTEMQGLVYGPRMKDAYPFKGVSKFFRRCFEKNIKISIISHRTIHPYIGKKYNLHDSHRNWKL